jgi:hypothetical protein
MNAKDSINHLRTMADFWNKAANDPKYYNTEGAYYLAQSARDLYKQVDRIEGIYETWDFPLTDEVI